MGINDDDVRVGMHGDVWSVKSRGGEGWARDVKVIPARCEKRRGQENHYPLLATGLRLR